MTPKTGALYLAILAFAALAMGSCDLILKASVRAAGGASKEIIEFIFTAALNGSAGVASVCSGDANSSKATIMTLCKLGSDQAVYGTPGKRMGKYGKAI